VIAQGTHSRFECGCVWSANSNKEKKMTQKINDTRMRTGAYETIAGADQAIRRLLDAGFSQDEIVVVCPEKFRDHFQAVGSVTETPAPAAGEALATGGLVGATLGGIALVATTIATGGGALAAAPVLIGGGALAGGLSNFLASKGYQNEADDVFKAAVQNGWIVVAVQIDAAGNVEKLDKAERILNSAGATALSTV
jgi:hypothetical protein